MENKIVKAHVECNKNGLYTVYVEDALPFGVIGEGHSAEEAKKDFLNVFDAMSKMYKERTGDDCPIDFEFVYDASAFLQHYKGMLTLVGLARITEKSVISVCMRCTVSIQKNSESHQGVGAKIC